MSCSITSGAMPCCSSSTLYHEESHPAESASMAQLKALPTPVLIHISKLLNIPLKGMLAIIGLLDEGATVPFIARYRKEVTGNLDEVQIRETQEKLEYFRELEDLYLPYEPKRRTKASIAREKGLDPLAQWLWDQTGDTSGNMRLEELAA